MEVGPIVSVVSLAVMTIDNCHIILCHLYESKSILMFTDRFEIL